jgi:hypothetical protein
VRAANAAPSAPPIAAVVGSSPETRQLICTGPDALAYLKNELRDISGADLELQDVTAVDSRTCRATVVENGKRTPGIIKLERYSGYERISWDAPGRSMSWPTGVRFNEPVAQAQPPTYTPPPPAPPPPPGQQATAAPVNINKLLFCKYSVPNIAHAAYCSIWRGAQCGVPPGLPPGVLPSETKDEIVARLFVQQHNSNSSWPLLGKEDIDYLVQKAMEYKGDLNSFIKDASDYCQTAWDQSEEDRRKKIVTH